MIDVSEHYVSFTSSPSFGTVVIFPFSFFGQCGNARITSSWPPCVQACPAPLTCAHNLRHAEATVAAPVNGLVFSSVFSSFFFFLFSHLSTATSISKIIPGTYNHQVMFERSGGLFHLNWKNSAVNEDQDGQRKRKRSREVERGGGKRDRGERKRERRREREGESEWRNREVPSNPTKECLVRNGGIGRSGTAIVCVHVA